MLPAYSGDAKARKRLNAIQVEIGNHSMSLADLQQVLDDIEPKVRREVRDRERAAKRAAAERVDRLLDALMPVAARIDAAVTELAQAKNIAGPLIDQARAAAGELIMQPAYGDIGMQSINRMLAIDGSVLRPLSVLLLEQLASAGVLPEGAAGHFRQQTTTLVETLNVASRILSARVQDMLARDAADEQEDAKAGAHEAEAVTESA